MANDGPQVKPALLGKIKLAWKHFAKEEDSSLFFLSLAGWPED